MLSSQLYIRTLWNDYFTGNPTNYSSQTYTSKQTPSDASVYVFNCLFRSITSSGSGGALYCGSSVQYLFVESSSFFSCKISDSGNGGAIYFSNINNGQSVLYEVRGYDCSTPGNYDYLFAYIYVYNSVSYKNYVNYSSVTRCVNENSCPNFVLGLSRGSISCPSVNSSLNKCFVRSGIACWPTVDSNSVTCLLTYSSFTDNHDTGYNCIYLDRGDAKYEIKSCNILRNTQVSLGSHGTIATWGYLTIDNSCILGNTATNTFYQGSSSYTITLSSCTVDSTSNNGYLTTKNTVTKSFILALNHMSTLNCISVYDVVGTLTPIVQSSSTKKQMHCFTHMKCFNQSRLSELFSLLCIFISNFIHPYTSNYP
jgi:hypothetical protein